ncbi:hypothetical protein [Nitrosomonas sp. Nm34]|uniref:hypothetical protein n=1 Tax=Nitrosomonas sp. Nm34 TaxID=1881055 RepID=UPI0008EB9982|nr:hypothetical protein [Nitrosomonas sp. Nm34]SFI31374.1 hypothetical protein SAMN05428978_100567 [Nitrosomonas sp. Nm34]
MNKLVITGMVAHINAGTTIGLHPAQAKARAHSLKPIADGVYEVITRIQFKRGEIIELGIDLPRNLADQMESVDTLETYERELGPSEEEIQAEKERAEKEKAEAAAKELAEKERDEAELKAKEEAELKAEAEAERKAKEEEELKAKQESELKAKLEADEEARRKAANDEMLQNIKARNQAKQEAELEEKAEEKKQASKRK